MLTATIVNLCPVSATEESLSPQQGEQPTRQGPPTCPPQPEHMLSDLLIN